MEPLQLALLFILIISFVIHEMAHGYAADRLGDPTPRLSGRLNGNWFSHIDPLLSVIIPGLLIFTQAPILFGAAKPMPYNPYNFTNQKWGEALVAAAGPAANLVIAIIFAIIVRFADVLNLSAAFIEIALGVIALNIVLTIINLLPIPPLDGSKILPRFLPLPVRLKYDRLRKWLEMNPLMGFFLIIFFFISVLGQPLLWLTETITYALAGF
jgi:Zn-dependent protease